jgi:hypothetical protein
MIVLRSNALRPRTGLFVKMNQGPCGQRSGSGCRPFGSSSPTTQIASQSVAPDGLFSFCAVRARQLMRATRPGTQESGMRRMVQFLNPQGWLYAHAWGLRLAALTCASLNGAGFLSLLHIYGVGGGFGWNLTNRTERN